MSKILLVEDDLPLLRMYQVAFEKSGHQIIVATDGESALRLAKKENPDLILLDMVLPKKSGIEVLKDLKNDGSKIPVICLTVLHQEEDIKKAEELGVTDYIVKTDISPSEVVEKVNYFLPVTV